ncbi:MAG: hypothetical protein JSS66_15500 [Armatimonadetes bacterium]|nr:hypothetical protein [Armatimonadota bacterium]
MEAIARWCAAGLLGALGTYIFVVQAAFVVRGLMGSRERGTVAIGLAGVVVLLGVLISPSPDKWRWFWVPLIVDPGVFILWQIYEHMKAR